MEDSSRGPRSSPRYNGSTGGAHRFFSASSDSDVVAAPHGRRPPPARSHWSSSERRAISAEPSWCDGDAPRRGERVDARAGAAPCRRRSARRRGADPVLLGPSASLHHQLRRPRSAMRSTSSSETSRRRALSGGCSRLLWRPLTPSKRIRLAGIVSRHRGGPRAGLQMRCGCILHWRLQDAGGARFDPPHRPSAPSSDTHDEKQSSALARARVRFPRGAIPSGGHESTGATVGHATLSENRTCIGDGPRIDAERDAPARAGRGPALPSLPRARPGDHRLRVAARRRARRTLPMSSPRPSWSPGGVFTTSRSGDGGAPLALRSGSPRPGEPADALSAGARDWASVSREALRTKSRPPTPRRARARRHPGAGSGLER